MFSGTIMKVVFAALSLTATQSLVSARAWRRDRRDYPEVQKAFKDWGQNYFWKSHDVETADGYELTLFRILGKKQRKQVPNQWTKGPILLLSGFTKDAYSQFDHSRGDTDKPFLPTTLFKLGYDVYLGSVRGSRYAISHTDLDPISDEKAFFDYDFEDIAKNDIPAMTKLIMEIQARYKADTGKACKKVTMIGHSHGAGQMIAALSYTGNSDMYVSQVVGIEPCLIGDPSGYGFADLDASFYQVISFAAQLYGIESLFGPDWDSTVALACSVLGADSARCAGLQALDVAGENLITSDNPWAQGRTGVKHTQHMAQNFLEQSFQGFSSAALFGNYPGQAFAIGNISDNIPIHAIWSDDDTVCARSVQEPLWSLIPSNDGEEESVPGNHGDQVGRQDSVYMDKLLGLIQKNDRDNVDVISGNCENWSWQP